MPLAEVVDLEILYSCLEKGVALVIHLDRVPAVKGLADDRIDRLYLVEMGQGGFFRFELCGLATITGVLGEQTVRVMFVYFRTAEVLPCLEHLFLGAEEAYKLTYDLT